MKYLKEYKTFTTPEEQRINDILDRGLDNASQDEIDRYESMKASIKYNL